jgi:hypothetical protein
VNQPKKRPGLLWMFFYGRRRRGFPWLLVGLAAAVALLALTFGVPGAAAFWPSIGLSFVAVLIVGTIVAVIAALLRPRRKP